MSEILGEALEFDLGGGTIVVVPTEKSPVASVNGKTGNVELKTSDLENDSGYLSAIPTARVVFLPCVDFRTYEGWDGESWLASGDCTVFVTPSGRTLLIDTGAAHCWPTIYAELTRQGVTHIDVFELTHYHHDHYGNLGELVEAGLIDEDTVCYLPRTKRVEIAGQEEKGWVNDIEVPNWGNEDWVNETLSGCQIIRPDNDTVLELDGLNVTFFNCGVSDWELYDGGGGSDPDCNNYSICNLVTYSETKVLMTGDIQPLARSNLLTQRKIPRCDILKVPHHGADVAQWTGWFDFFLTCAPKEAVVTLYDFALTEPPVLGANDSRRSLAVRGLQALGANIYATGYGTVAAELGERMYSVYGSPMEVQVIPDGNGTMVDLYVSQSYSGTDGIGSHQKPFPTLAQALARASSLDSSWVRIYLLSAYTSTEDLYIHKAKGHIAINPSGVACSVKTLTVYDSDIDATGLTLTGTGDGVLYISGGTGHFKNVIMAETSTSGLKRGVRAYLTTMWLEDCTISNKGYAIAAYNCAKVLAVNLSCENNGFAVLANLSADVTVKFSGAAPTNVEDTDYKGRVEVIT